MPSQDAIDASLVAELSAAVNTRVAKMEHNLRPDDDGQNRHKGDHLHLAFNEKQEAHPMGGNGIAHSAFTRLVSAPRSLAALDAGPRTQAPPTKLRCFPETSLTYCILQSAASRRSSGVVTCSASPPAGRLCTGTTTGSFGTIPCVYTFT